MRKNSGVSIYGSKNIKQARTFADKIIRLNKSKGNKVIKHSSKQEYG